MGESEKEEDLESVIFDLTKLCIFQGDMYYSSVHTAIAVHTEFNVHFLGVVKQFCPNYLNGDIVSALECKPAGATIVLTTTVK